MVPGVPCVTTDSVAMKPRSPVTSLVTTIQVGINYNHTQLCNSAKCYCIDYIIITLAQSSEIFHFLVKNSERRNRLSIDLMFLLPWRHRIKGIPEGGVW